MGAEHRAFFVPRQSGGWVAGHETGVHADRGIRGGSGRFLFDVPAIDRAAMKVWLRYAGAGLLLVGMGVVVGLLLSAPEVHRAIITAAAVEYLVQLVALALLLALRDKSHLFLAGWLVGMVLRFGVLGVAAFAVTRSAVLPRNALLLSLVVFVFLLLLLEPVFLRWDLRRT